MTPRPLTHQFSSLSYNVFSTILFLSKIYDEVTVGQQCMRSYDDDVVAKRSRPIWPMAEAHWFKLQSSAPSPSRSFDEAGNRCFAVRGGMFIFGSGIHTSVLPHVFRCSRDSQTIILWGTIVSSESSLLLLAVQKWTSQAIKKMRRLRHFYSNWRLYYNVVMSMFFY
jgi:hypothetical protein